MNKQQYLIVKNRKVLFTCSKKIFNALVLNWHYGYKIHSAGDFKICKNFN